MKKKIISLFLMAICHNDFAQGNDIEMITKLNEAWLNSYPAKDTATLNRIFAPDFVLISPKGSKMTKRDIINNLGQQETVSVNVDSIDVRLLTDNVGVVTAYTTFILKVNDKEVTGRNCYQDVYVKRRGRWTAVAAHVTLLNIK